jgi:hypothetical protein
MWYTGLTPIRRFLLLSAALLSTAIITAVAAPPANDTCPGAVVISSSAPLPYLTHVVTNVSAATSEGDPTAPTNCVASTFNGVWFAYQPAVSGNYTFSVSADTATTLLDSAMAVYSSVGNCAGLTLIACNDDEGDLKSAIHIGLTSGVTYYVLVWSAFLPADPGDDSVQLRVSRPVVPSNDTCANAEIIPASGPFPHFTPTNDITLATTVGDPPDPSCYSNGRKSVWFRFTPAASGNYFISTGTDTATTMHETVLAIYRSPTCSDYIPVACSYFEEDRAQMTRSLTAGTRYHIVVWDADTNSPTHGETSLQLAVAMVDRPTVITMSASQISSTNARLYGSFTPNALLTRTWFEWGTTTNYGNRTSPTRLVGSGVRPVLTNMLVAGLTPGTVYHYRAVGTNSLGTNYGANMSFVWSGTRPNITSLERQPAGSYRLRFTGVPAQLYRVEASETLTNWIDFGVAQGVPGTGTFEFLDTTAPATRRFYRVKGP